MLAACRICGNTKNNRVYSAREMMFGTRDVFRYIECGECGTIQIEEMPDLARYYPPDYYSLQSEPGIDRTLKNRLASRFIGKFLSTGRGILGRYLSARYPDIRDEFPPYLREPLLALAPSSRILDFGSGNGKLLRTLFRFGFRKLTGADAFVENDLTLTGGTRILKRPLDQLDGPFDLVMLHHTFEHLPDPKDSLGQIHRLIGGRGTALIRIPVASFAWERYGVDWVQLDPPRHLFLYTERAFRRLADETGLDVVKVVYDSEPFQFFASEQYRMDIPMNDPRSFRGAGEGSLFTQEQFDAWKAKAERLNAEGRGDQACFYLKRAKNPR